MKINFNWRIKMTNKPLVSIIMASFNESPYMIRESIESILTQTYKNIELLIFDDSTNENTKSAIDEFSGDIRVIINRFPNRIGFVPSLNMGLKQAKGKYIARMDCDDCSLPQRIEKEVDYLEKHPRISVVGGQIDIINKNDEVISHRCYPSYGIKLWLFSCFRSPFAHPAVMMRRTVIDDGFTYNEGLKMSEDLDLWLRLMNKGYKFANLKDTVLRYRVQENFNKKRTDIKQRKSTAQVRKNNFDKKHFLHGMLSALGGWLFLHLPANSLSKIYDMENKISVGSD